MRLSDKTMRVNLTVKQWTARKYDPEASKTVADKYHLAEASMGRYNKILVAFDYIKRINARCNDARAYHYANSLPWDDEGYRITTAKNFMKYREGMLVCEADFWAEVEALMKVYGSLKLGAKEALGRLWNEEDYPSPEKLKKKYAFILKIEPVSDVEDWRVDLQADDMERIKGQYAASSEAKLQAAMGDLWDRLYKAVDHMAERLTPDPRAAPSKRLKVFRDSLVENMIELTAILPALNVTGDERLNEMVAQVQTRLCTFEPNALREDEGVREVAKDEALEIARAMEAYMGIKKEEKADGDEKGREGLQEMGGIGSRMGESERYSANV